MAGPLGLLAVGPAAATIGVGDIDGGPSEGCWWQVRQRPPPELETLMMDPLGVLAAGLTAATTRVGDINGGPLGVLSVGPATATTGVGDIDGGPPGGCCRQVRQWPPSELETSMAPPLRGAVGRSDSGHHRSWRRRWRAP
jgi:hypothetical protein